MQRDCGALAVPASVQAILEGPHTIKSPDLMKDQSNSILTHMRTHVADHNQCHMVHQVMQLLTCTTSCCQQMHKDATVVPCLVHNHSDIAICFSTHADALFACNACY
eukprot:GHRR01002026.1.p1 GENE.GHRR01002026.1~~GHRR01002026.1.p1  ORF type:complete len:107 (-),score=18.62 GHRR01002026.1:527-847(-)